jgi:hypothetical protein
MRVPTGLLLGGGLLGPALFVAAFLVEGATRPGYDAMRTFVSQLSLGENGWMQIANFVFSGSLITAFAVGLSRQLAPGRGATWGPRLIGAVGIGLVIAGIFVTDPALGYPPGAPAGLTESPSDHGAIHLIGALLVFAGLPAAAIVFFRRFGMLPTRGGMRMYSLATAIVMLALFVAANIAASKRRTTAGRGAAAARVGHHRPGLDLGAGTSGDAAVTRKPLPRLRM